MTKAEKILLILNKSNVSKKTLSRYLLVSPEKLNKCLENNDFSILADDEVIVLLDLLNVNYLDDIVKIHLNKSYLTYFKLKISKVISENNDTISTTNDDNHILYNQIFKNLISYIDNDITYKKKTLKKN